MVSSQKQFVYLNEIPFVIEEQARKGYVHFRVDFLDSKKPRRERVVLRFWKDIRPRRPLTCPCGRPMPNKWALLVHQAKAHGK